MTRKEAIEYLEDAKCDLPYKFEQALNMAIKALQFVEHFDLLKEYQSLQEVVRCKDCKWYPDGKEACQYLGWDDDYCSFGERKTDD